MENLEYFVLNDDNKRDPNELFKELVEKCEEEKKENPNEPKNAPSES